MALGIYKSGQGYWVRVLTATGIGLLTLAAAFWVYQQSTRVADALPISGYSATFAATASQDVKPRANEEIVLLGKPAQIGGEPVVLGKASVTAFDNNTRRLTFRDFAPADPKVLTPNDAESIKGPSYQAMLTLGSIEPVSVVSKGLVQGGLAGLVLVIGAITAYYFCAIRAKSSEFLIATDLEMKKVHWSTRKAIRDQTVVVMAASIVIAAFLFVVDLAFQAFFRAIDIIRTS